MNSIEPIREFLGWCTVINAGFFVAASILVMAFRPKLVSIHRKMFGVAEEELERQYFQFLAQYEIAVVVLNLVPYIALRVMD